MLQMLKKYGINKFNYLTDIISAKEYNELCLELPSVKKDTSFCRELEVIKNQYIQHIDNLDSEDCLKILTKQYNNIIRKAKNITEINYIII